uniref:Cdc42 effector-like domain-containing protein n=1 Tax=Mola mola TaxID=94237 RepID=A0A3Q4AET5_MOLML
KRREVTINASDFRHITHIGSNAHTDSFGDLSFLKMGHGMLLQSSQSEQNLLMACSPPPKPPRLNLDEADGSESPDWHLSHHLNAPQKRKKCSSMPLLDSEEGMGEMEKEDGHQIRNNVASIYTHRLECGTLSSDKTEDSTDTGNKTAGQQKDEDGGFSFSLDLGPSILDDVLQVMEKLHN